MFDDYIDQLAEELDDMDDAAVLEDYERHQKQPGKDYEDYIERHVDTGDFSTVEALERHCADLWDEFDEETVSDIYEERLGSYPERRRQAEQLSNELPIRGSDAKRVKA